MKFDSADVIGTILAIMVLYCIVVCISVFRPKSTTGQKWGEAPDGGWGFHIHAAENQNRSMYLHTVASAAMHADESWSRTQLGGAAIGREYEHRRFDDRNWFDDRFSSAHSRGYSGPAINTNGTTMIGITDICGHAYGAGSSSGLSR